MFHWIDASVLPSRRIGKEWLFVWQNRTRILDELKKRLEQTVEEQPLFTLHWSL